MCVCPVQEVSSSERDWQSFLQKKNPQVDYVEGGNSSPTIAAVMTHDILASYIARQKGVFLQKPRFC